MTTKSEEKENQRRRVQELLLIGRQLFKDLADEGLALDVGECPFAGICPHAREVATDETRKKE